MRFEDVLARTDLPRVYLQSSVFARGSGANPTGPFDGGADGLGLDRANWAAGVQVVFPNVFDFSSLRARKAAATAHDSGGDGAARRSRCSPSTSQQQTAAAMVQAARERSRRTRPCSSPPRGRAKRRRARRYEAGLTSIVDVADAQSLLAQAEVQDELARVDVWRALLAAAVAHGDLTPFLTSRAQPWSTHPMWLIRAALRRPITVLVAVIAVALTAVVRASAGCASTSFRIWISPSSTSRSRTAA